MDGQNALVDMDRLQRHSPRHERQCRFLYAEVAPVPSAVLLDLQPQDRPLQLHLLGFKDALDERRQVEPHREAIGPEQGLAVFGIGDARLLEPDIRDGQQAEADIAADPDLAVEHAGGLLLENPAVTVPVHGVGHREQRSEQRHDEAGDPEERAVHAQPTPRGRVNRIRSCPDRWARGPLRYSCSASTGADALTFRFGYRTARENMGHLSGPIPPTWLQQPVRGCRRHRICRFRRAIFWQCSRIVSTKCRTRLSLLVSAPNQAGGPLWMA